MRVSSNAGLRIGLAGVGAFGATVGAKYLFHIGAARALGPSGFGVLAAIVTWVQVAILCNLWGYPIQFPRLFQQGKRAEAAKLTKAAGMRAVFLIAVAAVAIAVVQLIEVRRDNLWSASMFFLAIWGLLHLAVEQRRGEGSPLIAQVVGHVLPFGITAAALWLFRPENVPAALGFLSAACLISAVILQGPSGPVQRSLPPGKWSEQVESLRTGRSFAAISLSSVLIAWLDILILSLVLDTAALGIYSGAARVAALVGVGLAGIHVVAAPRLAAATGRDNQSDIYSEYVNLCWISGAIGTAAVAGLGVLGGSVLEFFGEEFRAGFTVMFILALGHGVSAWCGPVGTTLAMAGDEGLVARVYLAGAAAMALLLATVAPRTSLVGPAVVMASVTALCNVALWIRVRTRIRDSEVFA